MMHIVVTAAAVTVIAAAGAVWMTVGLASQAVRFAVETVRVR